MEKENNMVSCKIESLTDQMHGTQCVHLVDFPAWNE